LTKNQFWNIIEKNKRIIDNMKKLAWLFVLMSGILWGTISIYIKKLNQYNLDAMDIVAIRAVFTAVILFAGLLFYDRKLLKIRVRDIWCFVGTGILSIVFFNYCYFSAITMIPVSVAAILLYTAPAFVLVMSAVLFSEKINLYKIVIIFIAICGCGLASGIASGISSVNTTGILFGLGAGFGYALYSIFSRYALNRGYKSMTITFYTFLFASIASVPLVGTTGVEHIVSICVSDNFMLLFYIVFALMSTVLPYILYTTGLLYMDNSRASIIASIEPVTATIVGFVVFREMISPAQIIGALLVIAAMVAAGYKSEK